MYNQDEIIIQLTVVFVSISMWCTCAGLSACSPTDQGLTLASYRNAGGPDLTDGDSAST